MWVISMAIKCSCTVRWVEFRRFIKWLRVVQCNHCGFKLQSIYWVINANKIMSTTTFHTYMLHVRWLVYVCFILVQFALILMITNVLSVFSWIFNPEYIHGMSNWWSFSTSPYISNFGNVDIFIKLLVSANTLSLSVFCQIWLGLVCFGWKKHV